MGKELELFQAARNGQADVVERILNLRIKKSNPLASLRRTPGANVQDNSGYTCLHYAALNGHRNVVQILLQFDANVNLVNNKGSTCLHLAAWAGHYDVVNCILTYSSAQCNINLKNHDQDTALHCAAQFGHSSVCALLLKNGADATIRNCNNESPLDLASEYGRYETVEILMRLKPNLIHSETAVNSHSPLHLAAKNGHRHVVKLLLNGNFDVNCVTENGTALHEAAFYGKVDVVRTLLDYGIDTSLTNQMNKNVFDLLAELNTNVSQVIEKILTNYSVPSDKKSSNSIAQSDSLLRISPPANYSDPPAASVLYNSIDDFNDYVMPPKQFAAPSNDFIYSDVDFTVSSKNNFANWENRQKSALKSNFSQSQDSILTGHMFGNADNFIDSIYSDIGQPSSTNDFKPGYEEPIYSSPSGIGTTTDTEPNSLPVDFYSYPKPPCPIYSSIDPNLRTGSVNLKPVPPAKPPRKHCSMQLSRSQYHLNQLFAFQPYTSNIDFGEPNYASLNNNHQITSGFASIKRSTSNHNKKFDAMFTDENHIEIKQQYSTVLDQFKTSHALSSNELNNLGCMQSSFQQTVERIKVNENDFYAQVNKTKKSASKNSNLRKQHSFAEADDRLRPKSNKLSAVDCSTQFKSSDNETSTSKANQNNQATFVKAKANRIKRATIAILPEPQAKEFFQQLAPKPPTSLIAEAHILKVLNPIKLNYRKSRRRQNKETSIDEHCFSKYDIHHRKAYIVHRTQAFMQSKSTNTGFDLDGSDEENFSRSTSKSDFESSKISSSNKDSGKESSIKESSKDSSKESGKESNKESSKNKDISKDANKSNIFSRLTNNDSGDWKESEKEDLSSSIINYLDKIIAKYETNLSLSEEKMLKHLSIPLKLDWKHDPLLLYKQTFHYLSFYLGSAIVPKARDTKESQKCITKFRQLLEQNQLSDSLTVVILSISYKDVRYIDVNTNKILSEHEIRSVQYACQDMKQFRFFAYVTKEPNQTKDQLTCHVFSAVSLQLANEILGTLAQAFEIAYRCVNGESIDQLRKHFVKIQLNKPPPSPPPRHSSSMINKQVSASLSESQFNHLLSRPPRTSSLSPSPASTLPGKQLRKKPERQASFQSSGKPTQTNPHFLPAHSNHSKSSGNLCHRPSLIKKPVSQLIKQLTNKPEIPLKPSLKPLPNSRQVY